MRKISLLLLLSALQLLFAQEEPSEKEFRSIVFASLHLLPVDSVNNVYYTYRIPYNRLVFVKTGETYTSKFTIAVEVFDKDENFIVRNFSDKNIIIDNFEETNSRTISVEGLIEFKLGKGEFNIIPILTDQNSGRELKLKPEHVVTTNPKDNQFIEPIIVNSKTSKCGEGEYSVLANYEENFPFESDEYNLIIPVTDTTVNGININIINNKDTIDSNYITRNFISTIGMEDCQGKIILKNSTSSVNTKNFIIENFSNKLNVGNILISIYKDKNPKPGTKPDKTFQKSVVWYNKPFSLNDAETALKSLKYIEKDSVVKKMLNEDSDNYRKELFAYWKKYDPTPSTTFNELMNEYYQRVDYAAINFSSIAGKNGVDSDRGKILIMFGKPLKIERASNEYGKVVETWVYEKPQRKFIFVDEKGTGDFSLTNG